MEKEKFVKKTKCYFFHLSGFSLLKGNLLAFALVMIKNLYRQRLVFVLRKERGAASFVYFLRQLTGIGFGG